MSAIYKGGEVIFKYIMALLPWQRAPKSNFSAIFCQYFIILVYCICYLFKKKMFKSKFHFLGYLPLDGLVQGNRQRGRPVKRWSDDISDDVKKLNLKI